MERLNENDRAAALEDMDPDAIDPEFLEYVEEINSLPFAVTAQCCAGHLSYDDYGIPADVRPESSERWGYLQLFLTFEAAEWLCESSKEWSWLWREGSQVWIDGGASPGVTENGSWVLTFAWDARSWPTPAHDILSELGRLGDQHA